MFVSMNLQVTTQDVHTDMLEYDVYHSKHNYYMIERNEFKYGYAQHRKDSESYLVKEITEEIIQKLRLSNIKRN